MLGLLPVNGVQLPACQFTYKREDEVTHALGLEDVVDEAASEACGELDGLGVVDGLALLRDVLLVRVRGLCRYVSGGP